LKLQLILVARGKEARGQSRNFRSGQYLIPDAPEEIRGAEIPALGAVGELGVVEAPYPVGAIYMPASCMAFCSFASYSGMYLRLYRQF
jgi:hypothetical protein